jgi:hypothetical protein
MMCPPLFELSVGKRTSQLFNSITGLESLAAYLYAYRVIFNGPSLK